MFNNISRRSCLIDGVSFCKLSVVSYLIVPSFGNSLLQIALGGLGCGKSLENGYFVRLK